MYSQFTWNLDEVVLLASKLQFGGSIKIHKSSS